ncbi:hypothetical protein C8Q79DRAFT_389015 [Trametes meyenii]|nr:hypothetical protein C8Q79DRAFT_389015 [Trametes meyenii]
MLGVLVDQSLGLSLVHALSLLLSARLVAGATRSVVIDDTYGDEATGALPTYAPSSAWTQGKPCGFDVYDCLVNPDPNIVRNGTWHDSVGKTDDAPTRTIDLSFEGNHISVYCIISEVDRIEIAVSNMTFELDGKQAGNYFHDVSGQTDAAGNYEIHYNVSVFDSAVPDGKHTLRINSVGYSRMLFDYALYTTNSDLGNATASTSLPASSAAGNGAEATTGASADKSNGSHVNLGAIVGGVVAGVVALLAIGILVFVILRRRRQSYHPDTIERVTKRERRFYSKGDIEEPSYAASIASLPREHTEASSGPYAYSASSRYSHDSPRSPQEASPSASSVPLMEFPASSAPDRVTQRDLPRIVVVGAETRLEGPDNSMARIARQKVAQREAELTRRVREVEDALAAKYPNAGPSADVGEPVHSASLLGSSGASSTPTRTGNMEASGNDSEAVLRNQLDELKAEMERMRTVQQRMALELRDATEPPPEYQ